MKWDWNAIAKLGVPSVIALFLVWNLVNGFDLFDKRLEAIETQHSLMFTVMERNQRINESTEKNNERILSVLKIMCVNDAKTSDARERCLRD